LIDEQKISKYLPPYNTRHTFISHQIYDLRRDKDIVNAWCEHSEKISVKHYRNTKQIAMQINPELSVDNQLPEHSEVELLKKQNKMLVEQMEQMRKMIEELTNKQ
jgi:hypothetical protein